MAITKKDLLNLKKSIVIEVSEFLENQLHRFEKRLTKLEKGQKEISHDLEQIDRKLDKTIERADRHGLAIENHEKRIKTLETPKFA